MQAIELARDILETFKGVLSPHRPTVVRIIRRDANGNIVRESFYPVNRVNVVREDHVEIIAEVDNES